MTRTGPGRELSYQVQPILCASAVQRQWIVESVQYCAKFTLDKSRYKCFVKWLLLHRQLSSNLQQCQRYPIICTNYSTFQLLQLRCALQEKVGQCQGLEFQSSVHSAHRDCSSPHLTALMSIDDQCCSEWF